MSKHQSLCDIAALVDARPIPWEFVAKRELVRTPLFGWALAAGDQVVIDRNGLEEQVREAILLGFDPELRGRPGRDPGEFFGSPIRLPDTSR